MNCWNAPVQKIRALFSSVDHPVKHFPWTINTSAFPCCCLQVWTSAAVVPLWLSATTARLDILLNFADFFTHESCGIFTPCRAGNFIVQRQLKRVQRGVALTSDLDALRDWGAIMQKSSRCGLGKTAPNAVITSMTKFRQYFDGLLDPDKSGMVRKFDMEEAVEAYEKYTY